jgi:outer membrane murein-binding lipoprotein Lpp
MKYLALAAAISASIMLGGCFASVLNSYEISAQYPHDITAKQCRVAADCTDNGGGGGD